MVARPTPTLLLRKKALSRMSKLCFVFRLTKNTSLTNRNKVLKTRLVESLSSSINKDKKSVVLSYGQRLCDFGQRLLEAEPCFLPLKTKFKFSEKLSSVKSEVSAILSNQTKGKECSIKQKYSFLLLLDGTRLTRYSQELVNLVK